jgi:hypothetical protein
MPDASFSVDGEVERDVNHVLDGFLDVIYDLRSTFASRALAAGGTARISTPRS